MLHRVPVPTSNSQTKRVDKTLQSNVHIRKTSTMISLSTIVLLSFIALISAHPSSAVKDESNLRVVPEEIETSLKAGRCTTYSSSRVLYCVPFTRSGDSLCLIVEELFGCPPRTPRYRSVSRPGNCPSKCAGRINAF